jgi:hypothetical protein
MAESVDINLTSVVCKRGMMIDAYYRRIFENVKIGGPLV